MFITKKVFVLLLFFIPVTNASKLNKIEVRLSCIKMNLECEQLKFFIHNSEKKMLFTKIIGEINNLDVIKAKIIDRPSQVMQLHITLNKQKSEIFKNLILKNEKKFIYLTIGNEIIKQLSHGVVSKNANIVKNGKLTPMVSSIETSVHINGDHITIPVNISSHEPHRLIEKINWLKKLVKKSQKTQSSLNYLYNLLIIIIILFLIKFIYSYFKNNKMKDQDQLILLIQLNPSNGFYNYAQAMEASIKLNSQGINSVCEQAPSALMDSIDSYFIKVPRSQHTYAQKILKSTLSI